MVRKPLLLVMAAISIVVCAGIINATLWDIGNGWFTDSIQNEGHVQRTWFASAFGYDMNGKMIADAKSTRSDLSISFQSAGQPSNHKIQTQAEKAPIASERKVPVLLLLANGIIGLVGCWRRVAK